ncbi:MAG: ethanolamine utilization protein EutN [Ectothiorhodospiraceae bacterium]|nr:ethanolamine utilization protein EutN [Ectothiorhodospiraceae bacterium]
MILCKVLGTLVSTQKDKTLTEYKMLICHPVDLMRRFTGEPEVLAIDHSVDAGVGDLVLVAQEGDAAQQVLDRTDAPVHSVVVCVVDNFSVDHRYYHTEQLA